jgi:hypothetical protein
MVAEMNDEQCLGLVQELLATRIKLGVAYLANQDTGILTHQIMTVECGDFQARSEPALMAFPLMPMVESAETRVIN